MKTRIGVVILVIVSVGLAVALIATNKQSKVQSTKDADKILDFSNQLTSVNAGLQEQRQVNLELTNELAASQKESLTLSNDLVETKGSLQQEQDKVAALNGRVSDLETRNQALDENLVTLSNTIAGLSAQIADSQAKLANSETNNAFLTAELQKQIAQRTDLERKFNDLKELKTQEKKIRTDVFVARRLEWMREGTDPSMTVKGGQLLTQHGPTPTVASRQPRYDLNVEVSSDGSVRVVAPTNSAPAQ